MNTVIYNNMKLLNYRMLLRSHGKLVRKNSQNFATATKTLKENNDPVKYFGSPAAMWSAKTGRSGGADESVWFQPYVISGSLAVFLIYFCILREENDIDIGLERSLYDHVEGLEQSQLIMVHRYNKENKIDVTDIEKRMKELGLAVD